MSLHAKLAAQISRQSELCGAAFRIALKDMRCEIRKRGDDEIAHWILPNANCEIVRAMDDDAAAILRRNDIEVSYQDTVFAMTSLVYEYVSTEDEIQWNNARHYIELIDDAVEELIGEAWQDRAIIDVPTVMAYQQAKHAQESGRSVAAQALDL